MKQGLLLLAFFILLGVLAFRPVPKDIPESELLVHTGVVKQVNKAGAQDALLAFENSPITFYADRAFEKGLEPVSSEKTLVGKEVTVKYPSHWSLLDPKGQHKSVSIIEVEGERVFSAEN